MNKTVTILISIVVLLGIVFGFAYYKNHNKPIDPENSTSSSVTIHTTKSDEKLLASYNNPNIRLYQKGTKTVLSFNGKKTTFDDWSEYISIGTPKIYYFDIDNDKKKEIVLDVTIDKSQDADSYYNGIYVLKPTKNKDGSYKYDVTVLDSGTWYNLIVSTVRIEVTYVGSEYKRLQVVMNYLSEPMNYDVKTGYATTGHVFFAKPIMTADNKFYELGFWSRKDATYSIDSNNNIVVKIPVVINYKSQGTYQTVGDIHMGISLEDNKTKIAPNSFNFKPYSKYKVSNPKTVSRENWNFTINNTGLVPATTDTIINDLEGTFDLGNNTVNKNFSNMESEMKDIDTIEFTNKTVKLTAKGGYSFSTSVLTAKNYGVEINKGTKNDYVISYKVEITKNAEGQDVLTYYLDKSYPKSEIKEFTVKYGR